MKPALKKTIRLARDLAIDLGLMFIGLLNVTKAWPRFDSLIGFVLMSVAIFVAMKINISPFSDLTPRATLAAYVLRRPDDAKARGRRLVRMWVVLFVVPYVFFLPVVLIVRDDEKLQGYMAASLVLSLMSLGFMIAWIRNRINRLINRLGG